MYVYYLYIQLPVVVIEFITGDINNLSQSIEHVVHVTESK